MFDIKIVVFLCLSLPTLFASAKLAPYIDPCHYNDPECILQSAKKALPYLVSGYPDLGIPSLDPLVMPREIDGDNGDLKLKFRNMVVKDLSKCEFTKIVRPTPTKLIIELLLPFFATGDYKLDGKLFVVDTEGSGPFEIRSNKVKMSLDINMKIVEKNGEEYYKCTGFDYKYDVLEKAYFTLHNLYNGDKAKAEPIEAILDNSWKELINVVGQPVFKEVITQVVHSVGKVFTHVPRKEIELI